MLSQRGLEINQVKIESLQIECMPLLRSLGNISDNLNLAQWERKREEKYWYRSCTQWVFTKYE